jgi:hypothetical protein
VLVAASRNRAAFPIEHDGLAIKDHCMAQRPGGLGNRGKAICPIVATARQDAHAVGLDVNCQAIAIPLIS